MFRLVALRTLVRVWSRKWSSNFKHKGHCEASLLIKITHNKGV